MKVRERNRKNVKQHQNEKEAEMKNERKSGEGFDNLRKIKTYEEKLNK